MESPDEKTRCTAAVTKLNVQPNGAVTPCVFVPSSYGNVRYEPLKQIWNRMAEFDRIHKPAGKCPMSDPGFCASVLPMAEQHERVPDA
jgi:radical SAM protein with 4Fe4S-binding SPASM domain